MVFFILGQGKYEVSLSKNIVTVSIRKKTKYFNYVLVKSMGYVRYCLVNKLWIITTFLTSHEKGTMMTKHSYYVTFTTLITLRIRNPIGYSLWKDFYFKYNNTFLITFFLCNFHEMLLELYFMIFHCGGTDFVVCRSST